MSEKWTIDLFDCTRVIQEEVEAGFTQKQIATTYALAIRSAARRVDSPDWKAINQAILARWSMSGLERIKKRAMDICRGKIQP